MLLPSVLTVVAMGIWAQRVSLGPQLDFVVPVAALVAFVAVALWGCMERGRAAPNSFGPPVVA